MLWFSIFAFTVLTLSIFPVILNWKQRGKRQADLYYIWLMLNYCLWLIIFSVLFFSEVFVRPLPQAVLFGFGLLRMVVTVNVMFLYPLIISKTSTTPFGKVRTIGMVAAPAIYVILLLPVFLRSSGIFVVIITVLYNLYMVALSVSAVFYDKPSNNRSPGINLFFRLFLVYHVFSLVLFVLPMIGLFEDVFGVINILPRAVFCLIWGGIELFLFIEREYKKEQCGLNSAFPVFADDFRITPRERDIVLGIDSCLSNRQISDKLFISEKTVETHICSIYRKCGVKSRTGLIKLLSNYR